MQIGIASKVIVTGSGVGVNAAVKRNIAKIANRQGLRIAAPDRKPTKFSSKRKTGRTKAMPKSRINLRTKSRQSSNLIKFPKSFGVKPSNTLTACGNNRQAQKLPVRNKGVDVNTKKIAILFSRLCSAGVINDQIWYNQIGAESMAPDIRATFI